LWLYGLYPPWYRYASLLYGLALACYLTFFLCTHLSSCLSLSSFLCICYAFLVLRMWRSVGILVFSDFQYLLRLLNKFAMNTCFWHVSFHEGPVQCVNALQVLFSYDFDCIVYLGWSCVLLDFMISSRNFQLSWNCCTTFWNSFDWCY